MANKWEQAKRLMTSNDAKPWDVLKPSTQYLSEMESDQRFSICLKCPKLNKVTKTCQECGCFMVAKTKMKHASCPIGKW